MIKTCQQTRISIIEKICIHTFTWLNCNDVYKAFNLCDIA